MQQTTMRRLYHQGPEDNQPQKKTIYHIWREEIDTDETQMIESDQRTGPEPENKYPVLGAILSSILMLLCIGTPYLTFEWLPQMYQNVYDTTLSRTLSLTLGSQVSMIALPAIRKVGHVIVQATSSYHQPARHALGLITFYNGSFAEQEIPADTQITGKDGVIVLTLQTAIVPASTSTTPPIDGTVSVPAEAETAGAAGNVPAQDINQVCCGGAILAQNLDAFSGGQAARNVAVLTQGDLDKGKQRLSDLINAEVNNQAQAELKTGDILLPMACHSTITSTHQAGDQASSAALTLAEVCKPLAYFAPDIARVAQRLVAIPKGYHVVSFSAFVFASHLTSRGVILTVQIIAHLKHNAVAVNAYHFAGK